MKLEYQTETNNCLVEMKLEYETEANNCLVEIPAKITQGYRAMNVHVQLKYQALQFHECLTAKDNCHRNIDLNNVRTGNCEGRDLISEHILIDITMRFDFKEVSNSFFQIASVRFDLLWIGNKVLLSIER